MALAIFIPVLIISLLLGGAYIYITRYVGCGWQNPREHHHTLLGSKARHRAPSAAPSPRLMGAHGGSRIAAGLCI